MGDSETETVKIRNALGNLRRSPGEPISSILLKIDSLYTALYAMSQPQKTEKEVTDLVLKHKIYLVGAFVNAQALRMLMAYSRERATKGKQLTLEEIIGFLNRIEQNFGEASLTNVVNMPGGGNLLDSIQSGGQTINTFNCVDADTITGIFASSFHSHHKNRRQQDSRFSYKKNGYKNIGYNNTGYNRTDRNTRFLCRSNSGFPRGRGRNNGRRATQASYRQPVQRGYYFPRQRGQKFQQRGNPVLANERRARSPGPRETRSPIN